MPQFLSLSRAARLAGVSRGKLQEKIRLAALPTFEGQIRIDDLVKAYPAIDVDNDPVLERVELIKAKARPKSKYTDNLLPEPEVLMARLLDFQKIMIRTKSTLNTSEQLLTEVVERLEQAIQNDELALRSTLTELLGKMRHAMTKAEQNPDRKAELFAKDALLHILSASVKILPSGHEFFIEGKESILDSALYSGLHLDYGCSSGNCGACKVQVVSGEVRKIRDHDFVLSAQEKATGYILACSNTAVTDVILNANEALVPADLPQQSIRCTLRKPESISDDLTLIRGQTPRTKTLRFMAGQRVQVTLEGGQSRELPIASCPCDARYLQFLVRKQRGDSFVNALLASQHNQTLLINGPTGRFVLEEEATEPSIFVAVGDGFAPIKSLVEHAIAIDNVAHIQLYRIDDVPPGSYLGNLCRSWHDALDNFVYQRLDANSSAKATLDQIEKDFPQLEKCRIYISGPGQWVEQFVNLALSKGVTSDMLHQDKVDLVE